MLAVASPPHGRGTTLAGAATLSQALLIQRGLGTGGRAPGKILLSRALTATHVASCRTKIIYSQIEDGTERRIGESHDAAQDRLARGVHAQTCCQAGSSFAAGRQSDGGELLAVADRHLCPGPNQVWKALRKDFALTERIVAEEFAHVESKLNTTTSTGGISHCSAIPAMNGGRWVTAQGTAGGGMRRDDRDADFVFASLDLVNLHPFGKREQRIAFHHDLVSLSTQSDEFFWRAVYHPFSLSHQPHPFTDSPKSAMSHETGEICTIILVDLTAFFRYGRRLH